MNFRLPRQAAFVIAFALLLLLGCSGEQGPPRHKLTGAVTYEGKPVARGWIIFTPASGPGASANIEAGRYETPPGFGTIGGPHTVEVVAFDGAAAAATSESESGSFGKPLCRRTFQQDIPPQAPSLDFNLRADSK